MISISCYRFIIWVKVYNIGNYGCRWRFYIFWKRLSFVWVIFFIGYWFSFWFCGEGFRIWVYFFIDRWYGRWIRLIIVKYWGICVRNDLIGVCRIFEEFYVVYVGYWKCWWYIICFFCYRFGYNAFFFICFFFFCICRICNSYYLFLFFCIYRNVCIWVRCLIVYFSN